MGEVMMPRRGGGDPYKVGDVLTTARTDLGDKWLKCDGSTVTEAAYPELYPMMNSKIVDLKCGSPGGSYWGTWPFAYNGTLYAYVSRNGSGDVMAEYNADMVTQKRTANFGQQIYGVNTIRVLNNIPVALLSSSSDPGIAYFTDFPNHLTANTTVRLKSLVGSSDMGGYSFLDAAYFNGYYIFLNDRNKIVYTTDLSGEYFAKSIVESPRGMCVNPDTGKVVILGASYFTEFSTPLDAFQTTRHNFSDSDLRGLYYHDGYYVVGGKCSYHYAKSLSAAFTKVNLGLPYDGQDGLNVMTNINGVWCGLYVYEERQAFTWKFYWYALDRLGEAVKPNAYQVVENVSNSRLYDYYWGYCGHCPSLTNIGNRFTWKCDTSTNYVCAAEIGRKVPLIENNDVDYYIRAKK